MAKAGDMKRWLQDVPDDEEIAVWFYTKSQYEDWNDPFTEQTDRNFTQEQWRQIVLLWEDSSERLWELLYDRLVDSAEEIESRENNE